MARPSEALNSKQAVAVAYGLLRGMDVTTLAEQFGLYERQVLGIRRKMKASRGRRGGEDCPLWGRFAECDDCLDKPTGWVCPHVAEKEKRKR